MIYLFISTLKDEAEKLFYIEKDDIELFSPFDIVIEKLSSDNSHYAHREETRPQVEVSSKEKASSNRELYPQIPDGYSYPRTAGGILAFSREEPRSPVRAFSRRGHDINLKNRFANPDDESYCV